MDRNLIIVGVFLSIVVIWCFYNTKTEGYNPFINPNAQTTTATAETPKPKEAPWIPEKTPIPPITTFGASTDTGEIITKSVDPGAHLVCQNWCEQKGGEEKVPNFMTVCIDTCMQEKWTNPNSKLRDFKP